MTEKIEAAIAEQSPSRWQKLNVWLTTYERAMNYDPQSHTDATIRQLREAVKRLETRVIELENGDQRILPSAVSNSVERR